MTAYRYSLNKVGTGKLITPATTCRFPLWGDGKITHEYCGAPVHSDPYCEKHHGLCRKTAGQIRVNRRKRVLKLVERGYSVKQIVAWLGTTPQYIYNIKTKHKHQEGL